MLEGLPSRKIASIISVFLIAIFFVRWLGIVGYGYDYSRGQARCAGAAAWLLVPVGGTGGDRAAGWRWHGVSTGADRIDWPAIRHGLFKGLREDQVTLRLAQDQNGRPRKM